MSYADSAQFFPGARQLQVCIPGHAFDFFHIAEEEVLVTELFSGGKKKVELKKDGVFPISMDANGSKNL